jgi:hypothetical protein
MQPKPPKPRRMPINYLAWAFEFLFLCLSCLSAYSTWFFPLPRRPLSCLFTPPGSPPYSKTAKQKRKRKKVGDKKMPKKQPCNHSRRLVDLPREPATAHAAHTSRAPKKFLLGTIKLWSTLVQLSLSANPPFQDLANFPIASQFAFALLVGTPSPVMHVATLPSYTVQYLAQSLRNTYM